MDAKQKETSGRRMLQRALREALSYNLRSKSPLKKELEQMKRERKRGNKEIRQEIFPKISLVTDEVEEVLKSMNVDKNKINIIKSDEIFHSKKFSIDRGRVNTQKTHSTPCSQFNLRKSSVDDFKCSSFFNNSNLSLARKKSQELPRTSLAQALYPSKMFSKNNLSLLNWNKGSKFGLMSVNYDSEEFKLNPEPSLISYSSKEINQLHSCTDPDKKKYNILSKDDFFEICRENPETHISAPKPAEIYSLLDSKVKCSVTDNEINSIVFPPTVSEVLDLNKSNLTFSEDTPFHIHDSRNDSFLNAMIKNCDISRPFYKTSNESNSFVDFQLDAPCSKKTLSKRNDCSKDLISEILTSHETYYKGWIDPEIMDLIDSFCKKSVKTDIVESCSTNVNSKSQSVEIDLKLYSIPEVPCPTTVESEEIEKFVDPEREKLNLDPSSSSIGTELAVMMNNVIESCSKNISSKTQSVEINRKLYSIPEVPCETAVESEAIENFVDPEREKLNLDSSSTSIDSELEVMMKFLLED